VGWQFLKHALAVVLGANLLALSALAGASGGDSADRKELLSSDEILWLERHPSIRIALTPDYSPIEFFDSQGKHSGITADYFELIQQRLGFRFKAVHLTPEQWLQLDPETRGADVITASAETARRRQFWSFTSTYLTLPAYVITRVSAEDGLTLEKLAGLRVAVVSGWAVEEFIRSNHPNVIVESMPNAALALQKVSFGLVDAFVSELPVVEAWMEKEGVSNLKISAEAGYTYQLGISVRKDWPELLSILEKALATITPEERSQIVERWIHPHVPLERRREKMRRYLSWGAFGLAVLLVTAVVWNRLLAARVRAGTCELREVNATLEKRVAERTEELAVAKERAESADRLKSAFLATMSHELRTPLNSIIGFTGIMLQGLAGLLNPEQTKQLKMVQGSARHLLALINDVLDISKIEAGQLRIHPEPFELGPSLERVAAAVRPLADKKGLLLRVVSPATPVGMVSDRLRVEQVLLNLLNNAVKFTPQGEVALQAELVHDHVFPNNQVPQEVVRLQVTDTGIGIKEEDMAKLFQPFRQVDTGLARQHEGTGLGLAICRRLAEMLGGTIGVRSIWGIGTIFTFTVPLHRVNNHEARNPAN
jgi:signal transduction histidine kinase